MVIGETNSLHPLSPRVVGRFAAICLPILLLCGGVAFILYDQEAGNERASHARNAAHVVELQYSIISRQFESIESDVLYLSEVQHLHDYLSGAVRTLHELGQEYALFSKRKGIYDQIRYLDEDGRESIRINAANGEAIIVDEADLQSKAHRYYFTEAKKLGRGEIFVSALDLNIEHGEVDRPLKPVVRFATHVFDSTGRARGVLVLNYLGENVIRELKQAAANVPGQLILVNPDGTWIHGPRPEDDWGAIIGGDRGIQTAYADAWSTISRSRAGQFADAAGLFTFKTVRSPERGREPDEDRELSGESEAAARDLFTIVSHIPTAELYTRSRRLLKSALPLGVAGVMLIMILVWFVARAGVQRRIGEEKLKESEARLRAMSMRLVSMQEDDRRRISRDLHDDLGQIITAIILDLQRSVQPGDGDGRQEMIARALRGSEQLLGRIQDISSKLRPRILDDLGLQDAVESLLAEFETRTGIEVRAVLDCGRHNISPIVSENVFRIVQEALTNIGKHARVKQASLTLRASEARVTLTVDDEGVGFRPEAIREKALGIVGMRERVELLGGEFEVQSEPGVGTGIRLSIPIEDA